MSSIAEIIKGLDWSYPLELLLSIVPALICITFHELSHGYAAYALGDTTAKDAGRLSLNPIKHIDVFGLIMLLVFKFGWAKPVPVDMRRFRNPKRDMAITALAGPMSNIVLAAVVLFIYGLTYVPLHRGDGFASQLSYYIGVTAYLSVSLGIFNLIPIPPLDGSKVLFALLPQRAYLTLMRYERFGTFLLLAAAATGILRVPLSTAASWVYEKLFVIAEFAFKLTV